MVNFVVVVAFGAVFLPITLTVGVVPGKCAMVYCTHCILDYTRCFVTPSVTQMCIRTIKLTRVNLNYYNSVRLAKC